MTLEIDIGLRRGSFTLSAIGSFSQGVTAIIGPSGSGKSSLLRCIAGLESGVSGAVSLDGARWQGGSGWRAAHRRDVAYLAQQDALFPHLDVAGNLNFAARYAKAPGVAQRRRQLLAELEIEDLLERRIGGLSGGERQRVALARALVGGARLLLLDEPCANLDDGSRRLFGTHLARLVREMGLIVLHVSHDLPELAPLADQAVMLEAGSVMARGAFGDLVTRLELAPAADRHALAVLQAQVSGYDASDQLSEVTVGAQRLLLPGLTRPTGTALPVVVPASAVSLGRDDVRHGSVLNVLRVEVEGLREIRPGQVIVRLKSDGGWLLSLITARSARELECAPGRTLYAHIKAVALG